MLDKPLREYALILLQQEKKGHVCPPSDATHPKDRWEMAFVYSFICKFTQLKQKIEGFNTPMDLEDALLTPPGTPNKLLQDILTRFILILRPQSRNIGSAQVASTLTNLLSDFLATNERSVFWDDAKEANVNPLSPLTQGIWDANWDLKLKVLRQLVEYQLCHAPQIREVLDRAWGIKDKQHRKKEADTSPPENEDPHSQRNLLLEPVGQDINKKRYWILDNSPRLYVSTNPWKVSSAFKSLTSNKDEYIKAIDDLRLEGPQGVTAAGYRGPRSGLAHLHLIENLEERTEAIDAELARIERARKKIELKNLLLAQAEVRGPRTRRQTRRPDYVYHDDISEDDGQDDYRYEEDAEVDEFLEDDDEGTWGTAGSSRPRRSAHLNGSNMSLRRSSRQTNGKDKATLDDDDGTEWRGERRSRRLGASGEMDLDDERPRKRSRTVESSEADSLSAPVLPNQNAAKDHYRVTGAAALKSSEVAVDVVQGKKKNKFWFYAVEPVATPPANPEGADTTIKVQQPAYGSKTRRIVDSVSPTPSEPESGQTAETSERQVSLAPESSAAMSLDSEVGEE